MFCPRCTAPMRVQQVTGLGGKPVSLDLCLPCQSIWFDGFESSKLSPASTLALFRIVGEHAEARRQVHRDRAQCPRCDARMSQASDLSRGARFEYLKCPANHGRFMNFYNFLREREFLRPMTREEFDELRTHVKSLPCSNCGVAIDLMSHTACQACSAGLNTLDLAAAGRLISQLQQASREGQGLDPALARSLEARRDDASAVFDGFTPTDQWYRDAASAGLVGAGIMAVARFLTQTPQH